MNDISLATSNDLVSIKKQAKLIIKQIDRLKTTDLNFETNMYLMEKANQWIAFQLEQIRKRSLAELEQRRKQVQDELRLKAKVYLQ